jgi:hypothetical protein
LRPILPVVLHTGPRPWGTIKTLRDLLVEPAAFRAFLPDWQPLFWELAQHSPDELLHSGDAFVQVLALLRVEEQEQPEAVRAFREAMQQLGALHDTNIVRWQDMLRLIFSWSQHRRPKPEAPFWSQLAVEVQADEQRKQEIRAMQGTMVEEWLLQGQGEALRNVLLRQGRKKFGEPDAATLQMIQAITDVGRLERMSDAVLDANSWNELLAVT